MNPVIDNVTLRGEEILSAEGSYTLTDLPYPEDRTEYAREKILRSATIYCSCSSL